jgi:hypothetical protein
MSDRRLNVKRNEMSVMLKLKGIRGWRRRGYIARTHGIHLEFRPWGTKSATHPCSLFHGLPTPAMRAWIEAKERALNDIPTIIIDIDRKCAECRQDGAADNGLCLKCMIRAISGRVMRSIVGKAVQQRFFRDKPKAP